MAEFANAGMDKRAPRIDDIPPAGRAGTVDPWGELREHGYEQWPTLCVPFAPKVGFGDKPMDRVQAILNHLMMALGIPAHVRQSEPQEKLFERVNNRLRTLATPSRFRDQVERWYCLFVPDDSDASMRKLREWLPALRICALSAAEAIPDEDDLIALLTRFYSRKRKRMANA
jgi:hypothetical protein